MRRLPLVLSLVLVLVAVLLGGAARPAFARGAHNGNCGRLSTSHMHGHAHKSCPPKSGPATPPAPGTPPRHVPPPDANPQRNCPPPHGPHPEMMVACMAI